MTDEMAASVARSGTRRAVPDHPCESPTTVVAAFGGPARFASHFRKWTAQAMQHIAPLVFPSGVKTSRHGSMSSFEATVLLLSRLCSASGWDTLQPAFNRAHTNLCGMFVAALNDFVGRFEVLLDLRESVPRFRARRTLYKRALERFAERRHTELTDELRNVSFLLDGVRQSVGRSIDKETQRAAYSGMTKTHNLLYGALVSLCGIVVAVSKAVPGCFSDKRFEWEFEEVLRDEELVALCDGIFHRVEGVLLPVPHRKKQTADPAVRKQAKGMASLCIPVEWAFGHIKSMFPLAFCRDKSHVGVSLPERQLRAAVILYNMHLCLYGGQATTYLAVAPPTLAWYVSPVTGT